MISMRKIESFCRILSIKFFFSFYLIRIIFCFKRAIPIRILTVGKRRSPGVQLLVEEYMEKLRYYCSVEDVHVKSNPKSSRYSMLLSSSSWRLKILGLFLKINVNMQGLCKLTSWRSVDASKFMYT